MPDLMLPLRAFGWFRYPVFFITLFTAIVMISDDLKSIQSGVRMNDMHLIGRDFVNIWHGGRLAMSAPAARVYDRDDYRKTLKQAADVEGIYAFSYPPHMLLASIPFGKLSYWSALLAWTLLTTGLFWYAARPFLVRAALPHWSIFALPAFWVNLWAGHFGCLIGALALYGWQHARDRPALSGWSFAAMTVKPHLGILVPVVLAAGKAWRATVWAGAATLAMVAVSGIVLGWKSWALWSQSTLPFQASLLDASDPHLLYFMMMPTVERLGAWLGLAGAAKLAFVMSFAGVALVLMFRAWRARIALEELGLLSIIATFLLLPYVFNYDMVAYGLALLVLAARVSLLLRAWERLILSVAFLVPIIQMPLALSGLPIAPLFILALVWILVRHLSAQQRATAC
jgi:alpha-1,2-mannosyltransferase